MPSNEAKAAIERALDKITPGFWEDDRVSIEDLAMALDALAAEDAVCKIMAQTRFESIGVPTKWNRLNESEQAREIGVMCAALKALAGACRG